jgi:hypothetical protein
MRTILVHNTVDWLLSVSVKGLRASNQNHIQGLTKNNHTNSVNYIYSMIHKFLQKPRQ